MNRKALLFLNPKASRSHTDIDDALDRLRTAGFELIRVKTKRPSDIGQVIRDRRKEADCVIIGGGDGTCNAAADALVETGMTLGILPLGTANDLARTLEIPADVEGASDVIAAGGTRRIDVGWVNGKHFFNVASMGLSVKITRRMTRETKGRWGRFAYWLAAIQALLTARSFSAVIESDDQTWNVRSMQIAVGNGRYYGGGMTVNEIAEIDDGILHLYSIEVRRWWNLLPLLLRLRHGKFSDEPRIRDLHSQKFNIRCHRNRSINVDGEIRSTTPAEFKLVPRCLEVFAPAKGEKG